MDPVWITYAWEDEEEGDFSYLVQELRNVGVDATYDKVALIPGRRLWEQIADKITGSPLSGWAYLLTPNSLRSEACREELAYALDRALAAKGVDFPLIGLLHDVPIGNVPVPLRVRLCVSLASPEWKEEIAAALEGRPPRATLQVQTRFVWRIHGDYGGNRTHTAVEVRPRFGTIMYWRFVVPASSVIVTWGFGPAGGGALSTFKTTTVEGGALDIEGTQCTFFGAGDVLSAAMSAYAVFQGGLPQFLCFGQAEEPYGAPTELEVVRLAAPQAGSRA